MNRMSSQYEYMSFDQFEELLPDKPADAKWELIGGRVIRMMVGARGMASSRLQLRSGACDDVVSFAGIWPPSVHFLLL